MKLNVLLLSKAAVLPRKRRSGCDIAASCVAAPRHSPSQGNSKPIPFRRNCDDGTLAGYPVRNFGGYHLDWSFHLIHDFINPFMFQKLFRLPPEFILVSLLTLGGSPSFRFLVAYYDRVGWVIPREKLPFTVMRSRCRTSFLLCAFVISVSDRKWFCAVRLKDGAFYTEVSKCRWFVCNLKHLKLTAR